MKRVSFHKVLFIATLLCIRLTVFGQQPIYLKAASADDIPWSQAGIDNQRFVLAGEAHHVSCIFSFQLSQIQYLLKKGFRHLVWEMPYSFTMIGQQFLATNNDSLLAYISWSKEDSIYWRALYQLNQNLPENDRLHLWGIDIELAENVAGGAYRTQLYKKAFALLIADKGTPPPILQNAFEVLDTTTSVETALQIKHQLKGLSDNPEVERFFGNRMPDFLILTGRTDRFQALRNDEMLDAFKEICTYYHLDSTQKFLGRFGWGHSNKSYKKSIAWLLQNDPASPVKNSVFVVGVQYLHCASFAKAGDVSLDNYGIVDDRGQKKLLVAIDRQDSTPIKIFRWAQSDKIKGWAEAADILFVFSGFPAITPTAHKL